MKIDPPLPSPTPEIEFPVIPSYRMNNGLTLLCVEDHQLPRISLQLAVPIGRTSSPVESLGLAQLAVDMLKEGTESRSSKTIAETLDRLAIDFEADVLMEYSVISMTLLERQLKAGFELMSDILRNPSFPEVEFQKVKSRWRSYLISQRSDAGFLANERMFSELYPSHPYSKVSIPIEHLDGVDAPVLRDFFHRNFSPREAFLLFAGAIDLGKGIELAREFLEDWPGNPPTKVDFPALSSTTKRVFSFVHRPHSAQTVVQTGIRTISRSHPEFIPLKLANQIYGGGASARLFLNLREQKGYTYGAYSYQRNYKTDGVLLTTASVRTDATRDSIKEIFGEMDGMRKGFPDDGELARSKAELIGSFIRQTETPKAIGSLEVSRRLHGLPSDYYAEFVPAVRGVSPRKILSTAKRFINSQSAVTVVVGDHSLLESDLGELGEFQVFDTQGNRLH
jgi:predicted Zn-dependent peptidase